MVDEDFLVVFLRFSCYSKTYNVSDDVGYFIK